MPSRVEADVLPYIHVLKLDSICTIPVCVEPVSFVDGLKKHFQSQHRDALFFRVVGEDGHLLTTADLERMCLNTEDVHELLDFCKRRTEAIAQTYFPKSKNPTFFEPVDCKVDLYGYVHVSFIFSRNMHP